MNPIRARRSVDLLTWLVSPSDLLLGGTPSPIPFVQTEWPNPVLRKPSNNAWLAPNNHLTLYVAPFIPAMMDNPTTQKQQALSWESSASLALLTPIVAAPFIPMAMDNPAVQKQPTLGWEATASLALLTPASPFIPTMMDNPTVQKSSVLSWEATASLSLLTPIAADPFVPTLFANPLLQKNRAYLSWDVETNLSLLTTPVDPPFSQTSWPNPTLRTNRLPYYDQPNRGCVDTIPSSVLYVGCLGEIGVIPTYQADVFATDSYAQDTIDVESTYLGDTEL